MLILSRKIGERIVIGDAIQVEVLAIRGSRVRLGIAAPDHVSVNREEVDNRLQRLDGSTPEFVLA